MEFPCSYAVPIMIPHFEALERMFVFYLAHTSSTGHFLVPFLLASEFFFPKEKSLDVVQVRLTLLCPLPPSTSCHRRSTWWPIR